MKTFQFIVVLCLIIGSPVFGQLEKDTIKLKGVEISSKLETIAPYIINPINKSQLQSIPSRDMGDLLRQVPNVAGIRKGGSAVDPVIRGFKYSQLTVILDDGVKIENGCPNRMDPVSAHVEAEDIEKIEVIKGPYVLRYGPSFGGVINLVTESPRPYETFEIHANAMLGFETNWNGQKEHLSLTGGNNRVYFLVSGGRRNYGNYQSGEIEGKDTTFNSSFLKYNYSAKLGYAITSGQSLLLSYKQTYGRDVLYPALPMDEISDDTRIISADYQIKDLSSKISALDIKLYQSTVKHIMDNSKRSNYDSRQMIADVDARNTGGRAEMTLQSEKHNLLLGLDAEDIYKDGVRNMTMQMMGTTSTKKTNLWYKAHIQNAGLFAGYKTTFSSLEVNANLRFDYNTATSADTLKIIKNGIAYFNEVNSQFTNVSANIGFTKQLNDWLSISLALARGTRSPNMLERYIKLMAVGYDNYDYLGNPALKPEKNNEADLTLNASLENIGGFYLNGFYSLVNDYISAKWLPPSVITAQTAGVLGVKQFINTDNVTVKGFEFGYTSPEKHRLGGNLVAALTYASTSSVTKYIITNNQVSGETTLKNDALPEIPPFELTAGIYYKFLSGKITPTILFRGVASQNHTSEAFYEPDTPGFALLNFKVTYKINQFANLTAGVNNLFDKPYYEHLNRKIIGSSGKLYEPGRVFYVNLFLNI